MSCPRGTIAALGSSMDNVAAVFPDLASELITALGAAGRADLADQVRSASVTRVTFDGSANAAYIYVEASRPLNVVEQNIIDVRHGETIPVECRYWVNLDTDNFGRLSGIEILSPGNLTSEIKKRAAV